MDLGFCELLIDSRPFKLLDNAFLNFRFQEREGKKKDRERENINGRNKDFSASRILFKFLFRFDVGSIYLFIFFSSSLSWWGFLLLFIYSWFLLCVPKYFALSLSFFFILLTQPEELFDFQYLNRIAWKFLKYFFYFSGSNWQYFLYLNILFFLSSVFVSKELWSNKGFKDISEGISYK